jgi:hypothetical protein
MLCPAPLSVAPVLAQYTTEPRRSGSLEAMINHGLNAMTQWVEECSSDFTKNANANCGMWVKIGSK